MKQSEARSVLRERGSSKELEWRFVYEGLVWRDWKEIVMIQ
jgi:hypothetical protein